MRTLKEVEKEIAETKAELKDVHGTETEVYARIVGYYRAVKHWNNGKKDEFNIRKMFVWDSTAAADAKASETKENKIEVKETAKVETIEKTPVSNSETVTYEIYTRKTCPNCPPVKEFVSHLDMPGRAIDVDTEEGLAEAAKKGIFASPTVIFYNEAGTETARCHNVEELEAVFNTVAVNA